MSSHLHFQVRLFENYTPGDAMRELCSFDVISSSEDEAIKIARGKLPREENNSKKIALVDLITEHDPDVAIRKHERCMVQAYMSETDAGNLEQCCVLQLFFTSYSKVLAQAQDLIHRRHYRFYAIDEYDPEIEKPRLVAALTATNGQVGVKD